MASLLDPEIVKHLVVSNIHLCKSDREALDQSDGPGVSSWAFEYGWYVHVAEDDSYLDSENDGRFSAQFMQVMRKAKELGCAYITYDSDGPEYEELERHNWGG